MNKGIEKEIKITANLQVFERIYRSEEISDWKVESRHMEKQQNFYFDTEDELQKAGAALRARIISENRCQVTFNQRKRGSMVFGTRMEKEMIEEICFKRVGELIKAGNVSSVRVVSEKKCQLTFKQREGKSNKNGITVKKEIEERICLKIVEELLEKGKVSIDKKPSSLLEAEKITKGALLREVVSFETSRCILILKKGNNLVELALDTVSCHGTTWHEIEIELKEGNEEAIIEVADFLKREFELKDDFISKFKKAKAIKQEKEVKKRD